MCAEKSDREIEVTQKMIDAGVLCFLQADRRIEDLDEIFERVFRAMEEARHHA